MKNHTHPDNKYFPLNKFHQIQVDGLDPDLIKISAHKTLKDGEKISHTTVLNAIVKMLGFSGGYGEYKKNYKEKLKPFMIKNGLRRHANLTSNPTPSHFMQTNLQYLAERLFLSTDPTPMKLFTGYNFEQTTQNGAFKHINLSNSIYNGYGEILPHKVSPLINFLGDTLFKPRARPIVFCEYLSHDASKEQIDEFKKKQESIFHDFTKLIDASDKGWVDILPFNSRLIFLRGENGAYDFIFKGLKSKLFDRKFDRKFINICDLPYFIEDYHFSKWQYFEFDGSIEETVHETEKKFYATGGSLKSYPGQFDLIKDYMSKYCGYSNPSIKKVSSLHKNFLRIQVEDKELAVSNLISIKEFEEFLNQSSFQMNDEYLKNFLANNQEKEKSLPVTVNFYDVLKFCKWYSDTYNIQVRLLRTQELEHIRVNQFNHIALVEDFNNSDLVQFYDHNDNLFSDNLGFQYHPPFLNSSEFNNLRCSFNPNLHIDSTTVGLNMICSNFWAEWVLEKSVLRTGGLKTFNNIAAKAFRDSPPLESTGRRKHIKTGFRLCYDLS